MKSQRVFNQLFKDHNPTCCLHSHWKTKKKRAKDFFKQRLPSFSTATTKGNEAFLYQRAQSLEPQLDSFINSSIHPQSWVKNLDCRNHCALWIPQAPLPAGQVLQGALSLCYAALFRKTQLNSFLSPKAWVFLPCSSYQSLPPSSFSCLQLSKSQHISLLSFWSSCPNMDLQWQSNCFAQNSAKRVLGGHR